MIREVSFYQLDDLFDMRRPAGPCHFGWGYVARQFLSILVVVAPSAALRPTFFINEDGKLATLELVEFSHHQA